MDKIQLKQEKSDSIQNSSFSNLLTSPESKLASPSVRTDSSSSSILPECSIECTKISTQDLKQLANQLAQDLACDPKFGHPRIEAGDVSKTGDLTEHIVYPNTRKELDFSYGNRTIGQLASISLADRSVDFSFDEDRLQSVIFKGDGLAQSIDFTRDGDAFYEGEKVQIGKTRLEREILHHLRGY